MDEMRAKLLECVQIACNAATDAAFDAAAAGREFSYADQLAAMTDSLIAQGVTIKTTHSRHSRPPTDLTGKCGSCLHAVPAPGVFGDSQCYVNCTNEEHLAKYCRRPLAKVRLRTTKACKKYRPKEAARG